MNFMFEPNLNTQSCLPRNRVFDVQFFFSFTSESVLIERISLVDRNFMWELIWCFVVEVEIRVSIILMIVVKLYKRVYVEIQRHFIKTPLKSKPTTGGAIASSRLKNLHFLFFSSVAITTFNILLLFNGLSP